MQKPKVERLAKVSEPRNGGEVQSLVRGLTLLECFVDFAGQPAGLNELALRTGLSPSTTHRLLATLQAEGYVTRDRETNRYVLGHRLVGVGATIQRRTSHIRAIVRPHLEAIGLETGETTYLVVLDENRAVYIDSFDGSHALRMAMRVGTAFPAHTSASAKAISAFQPDDSQIVAIFVDEPLRKYAKNTITTAKAYKAALKDVRRAGYAIESEEVEEGVSCVAAPILDAAGFAIAAISVPGPTTRIVSRDPARLGELIKRHTDEISLNLRRRPGAK